MKLILKLHQRAFFTSDSHYGHHNMCSGISRWKQGFRNYQTLEEMNDALVDGINSVVREDDVLFHLGDWSFGGIDNIWEFRKRIRCKNIYLILGNHDEHIELNKKLPTCAWESDGKGSWKIVDVVEKSDELTEFCSAREMFVSVHDRLTLELVIPNENGTTFKKRFELSHYPFCSWKSMNQGVIHLHGHVHLPDDKKVHEGRSMDAGVDGNSMVPYMLQEIAQIMRERPIRYTTLTFDHHTSNHDDEIRENTPKAPKLPKPGRSMSSELSNDCCDNILVYISTYIRSDERDNLTPEINMEFKQMIERIFEKTKLNTKLNEVELNDILVRTLFSLHQVLEKVRTDEALSNRIRSNENPRLLCGNYFTTSAKGYIFGNLHDLNKKIKDGNGENI